MVVSKLWLAGHLLPNLKPYTRRETAAPSGEARLWERAAAQGAAQGAAGKPAGKPTGKPAGSGAAPTPGGGGGAASSGSADLPPLRELLTSQGTVSSLTGSSGSMEEASSRSSILDSITVGSQVGSGRGALGWRGGGRGARGSAC